MVARLPLLALLALLPLSLSCTASPDAEASPSPPCNAPALCFALDGSASLSSADFALQKSLVSSLVSLTVSPALSAVQYGLSTTPISTPTSSARDFLDRLDKSFLTRATRTFVGAGLAFCVAQLRASGSAGTILVLGDGRANFAESSVELVLKSAGDIDVVAVGVGFPRDSAHLKRIAKGRADRVFIADDFTGLDKLIEDLLTAVCLPEVDLEQPSPAASTS